MRSGALRDPGALDGVFHRALQDGLVQVMPAVLPTDVVQIFNIAEPTEMLTKACGGPQTRVNSGVGGIRIRASPRIPSGFQDPPSVTSNP